jgi:Na+/H+ antiporter NhaD/arsenite permease-like protein
MDRLNQFATRLGFAILLAFAWMTFLPMDIFGMAVVAFTVILVYFLQRRDRKRGTIVIDERKDAVRNRSTRISWLLTMDLVGATFILDHLGYVQLSFESMAVTVVGFMIGSQLFIETYYYRSAEP